MQQTHETLVTRRVCPERAQPEFTVGEFSQLHSLLSAIVSKELGGSRDLPETVQETLAKTDSSEANQNAPEGALQWVDLLDLSVSPHLLRRHLAEFGAEEAALRALIRFLVVRHTHLDLARDKVDWLATNLVRIRQERRGEPLGWPKVDVNEMLRGIDFRDLSQRAAELLSEVPSLLDEVKYLERFSQITDSRLIERARQLKAEFGEEFFHPQVLTAIVNYNLMFGNKFHELLQETARTVREMLEANPQPAPDTQELLESDYRLTASAFQHLSKLEKSSRTDKVEYSDGTLPNVTDPPLPNVKAGFSEAVARQLVDMGIDESRQRQDIRNRVREIGMRLRSNPRIKVIGTPFGMLELADWEAAALQADYPGTEESFRADFANCVSTAIGIVSRIEDELAKYCEARGNDVARKIHYDALVFSLLEGRRIEAILAGLSAKSRNRGLADKSAQLDGTADKLKLALKKLIPLFAKAA